MRVDDFDYSLPEELIALEPADKRDSSRLLHLDSEGDIRHYKFSDLLEFFGPDEIIVLNDTKVFPAAMTAIRPARQVGGGADVSVDINLHKLVRKTEDDVVWRAFVRPAKRVSAGDQLHITENFTAKVLQRDGAEADLVFSCSPVELMSKLEGAGRIPLPPYISRKRAIEDNDRTRYQTVFASASGSVAAPTAGLHFTEELLEKLKQRGTRIVKVTLHVGAGTFLPVTTDRVEDHVMHSEWGQVRPDAAGIIQDALDAGKRITCVGTTALRLVESAATASNKISAFEGETDIFITPGFQFNIADRLITNFHLPKSTLMMLVSAFSGQDRIMKAYSEAIARKYRFFSYGDACLLERLT